MAKRATWAGLHAAWSSTVALAFARAFWLRRAQAEVRGNPACDRFWWLSTSLYAGVLPSLYLFAMPWLSYVGFTKWPTEPRAAVSGYIDNAPGTALFGACFFAVLFEQWRFSGDAASNAERTSFSAEAATSRVLLLLFQLFLLTMVVLTLSWQPLAHTLVTVVFSVSLIAFMLVLIRSHPAALAHPSISGALTVGIVAAVLMNLNNVPFSPVPFCGDIDCLKLLPWPGSPTYDNWLWFGESVALAAIALMAPLTVLLSKSNDEVLEDLR